MQQSFIPIHPLIASMKSVPLTRLQNRLAWGCALWLLLWIVAVLFGPQVLAASGLSLNVHGHPHVYAHGHPFVDARGWLGIPNALDVLSNLPLVLFGLTGLIASMGRTGRSWSEATRPALGAFFGGLMLTGLCSAIYHWAPDIQGLVLDRLGMAVTFAGALALAASERIGAASVRPLLLMAATLGALSATMPLTHGNPIPWVVVQFGGMVLLLWLSIQRPQLGALGVRFAVLLALYALAKLLESADAWIFHVSSELVSGHSLKHLVAALAAWPVLHAMRQNARARGLKSSHTFWRVPFAGQ